MRLRHIGIVTQDIERMIKFYKRIGLEVISDTEEKVHIVKLTDGKMQIELLQYESQSEIALRQKGISHVAFTIDPDDNPIEIVALEGEEHALGQ